MSAPTWDDVVEASVAGQAVAYAAVWPLAFRAGYEAAVEDLRADRVNARIARAGAEGIDVRAARLAADRYARSQRASGEWCA